MPTVFVGEKKPADDINLVKLAHSEGARINRIDEWFHTSRSKITDFKFWAETPIKKSRWTARSGYRIDRSCNWWINETLAQKIQQMP